MASRSNPLWRITSPCPGGTGIAERAPGASPIDAAVMEETAILGSDEGGANRSGHAVHRHVDAAHVGEPPDRLARAVQHAAAFAGPESLNLGGRGATVEAAGAYPRDQHQDEGQPESQ